MSVMAMFGNRPPIVGGGTLARASRSQTYRGIVSQRNPEQGSGSGRKGGRFHLEPCAGCARGVWVGPAAVGMRVVCETCS